MTTKAAVFLVILCLSNNIFGQKISKLKLDNKLSILNDRAFFQFPTNAENVARQGDIMSADPNKNEETRIMLDIDKQRLVFFARELFETNSTNLLDVIQKESGDDLKCKILTDKDSLLSILSTPLKFDKTKNAILVNNLFVRTPDNTVFVIGAYINPDAFKNKDQFQKLSEKVFASLTNGTRKLNFKARTENLPIFDGEKNFKVEVPDGFVITKDKKYDFEVFKFRQVKDYSDTNWVSLTMYVGDHPSYFYRDYDLSEDSAEKVKGTFVGQDLEWMYFKNPEEYFYLKEQQIPTDKIEEGIIVHIAMMGSQSESIEQLTKLVENIQLVNK